MKATVSVDHTHGQIIAETCSPDALQDWIVFLDFACGKRQGGADTFDLIHPETTQHGGWASARFDDIDAIRLDIVR